MAFVDVEYGIGGGTPKKYKLTGGTTISASVRTLTADKDYPYLFVISPGTITVVGSAEIVGTYTQSTLAGGQVGILIRDIKQGDTFNVGSSANASWWFYIEEDS